MNVKMKWEVHSHLLVCQRLGGNLYLLFSESGESDTADPVGISCSVAMGHHCHCQYYSQNLEHEFGWYLGIMKSLSSI